MVGAAYTPRTGARVVGLARGGGGGVGMVALTACAPRMWGGTEPLRSSTCGDCRRRLAGGGRGGSTSQRLLRARLGFGATSALVFAGSIAPAIPTTTEPR